MNVKEIALAAGVVLALGVSVLVGVGSNDQSLTRELQKSVAEIQQQIVAIGGYLQQQAESLGATGTRFPNGVSADTTSPVEGELRGTTLTITGAASITGTTTLQSYVIGSQNSFTLAFAAAATTTGGLGSLQNTGVPKVCHLAEVAFSSQFEGAMNFGLSTSTSATNLHVTAPNLIATTTIATGTAPFLNNLSHPSIFFAGVENEGTTTTTLKSFLWGNGVFIVPTLISDGYPDNASTSDYTTAVGKVYMNCHAQ